MSSKASDAFEKLVDLTATLRSPGGCAWDRAQTVATIRPHLVEEFHEVLEAMDTDNDDELRDELGTPVPSIDPRANAYLRQWCTPGASTSRGKTCDPSLPTP